MKNIENFSFNFTPTNLDISSNGLSANLALGFTPYRTILTILFFVILVAYYLFLQGSITKLPYSTTTNFIFILVLLYFFLALITSESE